MPTPVFPTAYKVLVKGLLFGVPIENVWYCQGPDPFDVGSADSIAAAFATAYGEIATPLSADITFTEIEVTNLGGTATGQHIVLITPPQAGGAGVGSEPGSTAFCVSLRTALAGRRFRGRKYFSGLAKPDVVGNMLDSSVAADIVAGVNNLVSALAGIGLPLSIFSTVGSTLVPVTTALATDLRVDSQRGRLK